MPDPISSVSYRDTAWADPDGERELHDHVTKQIDGEIWGVCRNPERSSRQLHATTTPPFRTRAVAPSPAASTRTYATTRRWRKPKTAPCGSSKKRSTSSSAQRWEAGNEV